MRVTVTSEFPASAETVWSLVKQTATLPFVCRGMIGYSGVKSWPKEWQAGESVVTRLWLFNFLPANIYTVKIISVDEAAKRIETQESGGSVKSWNHSMWVNSLPDSRCKYTDSIDIEAGWLTAGIVAYAKRYYRYRHRRWLKLLAKQALS